MSEPTKACNLTQWEIEQLIDWHGCGLTDLNRDDKIERINYLNKRLKEFKKADVSAENKPETAFQAAEAAGSNSGWR